MKSQIKLLLIIATFALIQSYAKAQDLNGTAIRNTCIELIPELNLQNKILFINIWQSSDLESRDNNKEFQRVSNIYTQAKLKNGLSGVAFINLSVDTELFNWIVSTKKDSISSKFSLENTNGKYEPIANYFNGKPGNIVIGNDGTVISKNIKKEDCFFLFRSLITR